MTDLDFVVYLKNILVPHIWISN